MTDTEAKKRIGWMGSIFSGAASTAGGVPALAPSLGASIFGGLGSLTAYRPYFLIFAAASLAWMFFRHFKNRVSIAWTRGAAAVPAEFKPRSGTDYRLYLGAAAVILLMAFPQWGRPLLAKPNNPCAAANPCAAVNPCAAANPCGAKPPSRK